MNIEQLLKVKESLLVVLNEINDRIANYEDGYWYLVDAWGNGANTRKWFTNSFSATDFASLYRTVTIYSNNSEFTYISSKEALDEWFELEDLRGIVLLGGGEDLFDKYDMKIILRYRALQGIERPVPPKK